MMRRRLLTALLLVPVMTAGCWDYRDIENRTLIMGVAIDRNRADDGYVVTLEIPPTQQAQPESGTPQGGKIVLAASGRTLGETMLGLAAGRLGRLPIWDQVIVFLVSPEVLEEMELGPLFDLIVRTTRMNSRARLFVVDGEAAEVLAMEPDFHPLASLYFRRMEEQFSLSPRFARPRTLSHIATRLAEGSPLLLPRVVVEDGRLEISGAAIIVGGEWIGWLNAEDTFAANWVLGEVEQGVISVPCPVHPDGWMTLEVQLADRVFGVSWTERGPKYDWRFLVQAQLVDLQKCPVDPNDPEDRVRIAEAMKTSLERDVTAILEKARDTLGVDLFGLSEELRRRYPALARDLNWEAVYPLVEFSVSADVRVQSIGALKALPFSDR